MIMLVTAQELAEIAAFFYHSSSDRLQRIARDSMTQTLTTFVQEEQGVLIEAVKEDSRPAYQEMLGSYINPGHSLEDAWFIMHLAERIGDRSAIETGAAIVKSMTTRGWDDEYGGLPQFLHKDGGPPRGIVTERNRADHMIVELRENWGNKLWWVHSEALYALVLAWEHTTDEQFLDTYWKFHEYVFNTFPNPDTTVGEWVQIRDRRGEPEEKIVALPVKDPYHIIRACMHIVKSLERMREKHS